MLLVEEILCTNITSKITNLIAQKTGNIVNFSFAIKNGATVVSEEILFTISNSKYFPRQNILAPGASPELTGRIIVLPTGIVKTTPSKETTYANQCYFSFSYILKN
ncbi:MAG: hypothetical protein ACRC8F_04230 [Cetobacterium sp.]